MVWHPSLEAREETKRAITLAALPGNRYISQTQINDIIEASPELFPVLSAMTEKDRRGTISHHVKQWLPPWNQTGKKPRARVWVLVGGDTCAVV